MLILLFRSSTATAQTSFSPIFVSKGEREREREGLGHGSTAIGFDFSIRLPRSQYHASAPRVHARGQGTRNAISLSGAAAFLARASVLRGLFVRSRVTAAYEREETKKWKEADVPPRPLPVRISGHQLRLAANFRSIIAMREDDSPNHSAR